MNVRVPQAVIESELKPPMLKAIANKKKLYEHPRLLFRSSVVGHYGFLTSRSICPRRLRLTTTLDWSQIDAEHYGTGTVPALIPPDIVGQVPRSSPNSEQSSHISYGKVSQYTSNALARTTALSPGSQLCFAIVLQYR